jgi:hypothetical protein
VGIDQCYPKYRERGCRQNGVHVAPRRQVSTWSHAVKDEASAFVRVLSILPSTI